jgi:CBS domain-containing protein
MRSFASFNCCDLHWLGIKFLNINYYTKACTRASMDVSGEGKASPEVEVMKIKEWMVKNPITVTKDHTIQECADLMKEHSIRHLPVVENGRLCGLVTESGLRQAFLASMFEDLGLEDVMITDPITARQDVEIEDAAKVIFRNKIGGLPVVDSDNRAVGILTVVDLVAAIEFEIGRDPRRGAGGVRERVTAHTEPWGGSNKRGDLRTSFEEKTGLLLSIKEGQG